MPAPNLLIITVDQMRADVMGAHRGRAITPHLDILAAEGADLQLHFANSPVCVPSRTTLYTGRYAHAHRVLENDARLASHEAHLFKVLQAAGYRLGYFGKNHLLPSEEFARNCDAFDEIKPAGDYPEILAYNALSASAVRRMETLGCHAGAAFHDLPDEATTTGRTTLAVERFLEETEADRPWCAVASFHDPHAPHLAPRRFGLLHPAHAMTLPPWEPAELNGKSPRTRIKWEALGSATATDDEKRHYLSVYLSMCAFVDEQIGRLRRALARRPDAGHTVIVFVSDHGEFAWQHGMCKKDLVLWDALLHVPFILHWPARLPPQIVDGTLSEHVDVLPTLLDLLGLPPPPGVQGTSLVPLLLGESGEHKDVIFAEVCHPWMQNPYPTYAAFRSAWLAARGVREHPLYATAPFNIPGDQVKGVRTKRWKYLRFWHGFEELYDLESDPGERRNLAVAAERPAAILSELRELLLNALMRTAEVRSPRDDLALANAYPLWRQAGMASLPGK